ncbi:MAG TPA: hypothetical protein VG737_14255 [Cyclobacteriaceae bacterium]|nr:hypothetical protein [Cyclobacteriaceae bacterium]
MGDLGIQFEALRRREDYDLVYAPCQTVTCFLGVLSYFGIFKKKIVAIAHHPFMKGRLGALRKYSLYFALRGHTLYPALGQRVAEEINHIAACTLSRPLHWGPELEYYDRISARLERRNEIDLLAIGRTGRDYQVLIRAFEGSSIRVHIYTTRDFVPEKAPRPNIRIHYLDDAEQMKYPEVIRLILCAKILAIPLFIDNNLSGLTGVTDGLALSVPMLITRNKYIDADIEEAGAGYWIDFGDAKGWRNRAEGILKDSSALMTMGKNARRLAEEKFNSNIFGREVAGIIEEASGPSFK